MLKVLFVSHSYIVSENKKNIEALKHHCNVKVVLPHKVADRAFLAAHRAGAVDDTYLVRHRISFPRSQYWLVSLSLGMRSFRPDIIHVEYDPWSMIFWQVCLCRMLFARSAKIVCNVKKNTFRQLPQPLEFLKRTIAKFFIKRVDYFVAVNRGVCRIYMQQFGIGQEQITVLQHLGVDVKEFAPDETPTDSDSLEMHESPLSVGYCGRLDEHKGIRELISAVSDVREEMDPRPNLVLLGNGKMRTELLDNNHSWLQVMDPVPHHDVAAILRKMDVFVLPSRVTPDHEEHDGHALIEALSCGVASIGSTSGVIPELLRDGGGLVFPASDVDSLRRSLRQLLTDHELRRKASKQGAAAARKRYSLQAIAKAKAEIYERISA